MATQAAAVAEQVPPAADSPEEAPAAPKKKRKTKLIILAAVPVLLLAGGAGAYFTGMLAPLLGENAGEAAAVETPPEPSVFYDLPEMLVNLNSQGKKASFLKIKVSLELDDQDAVKQL